MIHCKTQFRRWNFHKSVLIDIESKIISPTLSLNAFKHYTHIQQILINSLHWFFQYIIHFSDNLNVENEIFYIVLISTFSTFFLKITYSKFSEVCVYYKVHYKYLYHLFFFLYIIL